MRFEDNALGFVVNFLLGIAWAFVFLGSIFSFLSFYKNNLFFALVFSLIGALPGMLSVLFLEHIITTKQKYQELQKQTKLLQKLLEKQEQNG